MTGNVPYHIAIIPDGNRRWAQSHKKEVIWSGHEQGALRFEEVMRAAFKAGVTYVTIWAASEDNLIKRPAIEVRFLVDLLTKELRRLMATNEIFENNIRVQVVGKGSGIVQSKALAEEISNAQVKTKGHTKHILTILFGYDGRTDVIHAIHELRDTTYELRPESVAKALMTKELPDVDLVIRTGGEPHNSAGFLMWQTANSQLYFTQTLWPDFDTIELKKAFDDFAQRERRLGK